VHRASGEEASTFWSGLGAVRRSAFLEAGGFDESRRWLEDVELGYRLKAAGRRIRLEKSLVGKHHKRWTLASTLRSDIFHRALPWTELMWEFDRLPKDLNFRASHRASGALAVLLPGLVLAAALLPGAWRMGAASAAAGAVLGLLLLNRGLYGFLLRKRGAFFAARSVLAHGLYYLAASLTLGVCWAWFSLTRRRGRRSPAARLALPDARPLPGPEA
jgi:hypothetical protein